MIPGDAVQAWAAPGGRVTVTEGFLRLPEWRAGLAHEEAHVCGHHGLVAGGVLAGLLVVYTLTGWGVAALGGGPEVALALAVAGAPVVAAVMSAAARAQEYAADAVACRQVGVAAYVRLLRAIPHAEVPVGAGWLDRALWWLVRDHPSPAERERRVVAAAEGRDRRAPQ